MKKNLTHFLFGTGVFLLTPVFVFGAVMSISTNSKTISVGDTIIARVIIDTEGKIINSSEGEISLDSLSDIYEVKDLSVAGSDFTLWLRAPVLSTDKKTISFTGGVPGGLSSRNLKVFSIILEAKKSGEVVLTPQNISVFLNDGKGTTVATKSQNITLSIGLNSGGQAINEWSDVVLNDKISPQSFTVSLGSDASLFSGKTFIAFNAVDNESGIDHYEITEGSLSPVRASSPYVLQNQKSRDVITVAAYDRAGNMTVSAYDGKDRSLPYNIYIGGVAVLFVVLFIGIYIMRKKKN